MVELGDRVKDKISGLKGIVVGISNYLYGCRRISIQPEESKDGNPAEWFTIDEPQVDVVEKAAINGRETPTHGPRENVLHRKDAYR